MPLIFFMRLKL